MQCVAGPGSGLCPTLNSKPPLRGNIFGLLPCSVHSVVNIVTIKSNYLGRLHSLENKAVARACPALTLFYAYHPGALASVSVGSNSLKANVQNTRASYYLNTHCRHMRILWTEINSPCGYRIHLAQMDYGLSMPARRQARPQA